MAALAAWAFPLTNSKTRTIKVASPYVPVFFPRAYRKKIGKISPNLARPRARIGPRNYPTAEGLRRFGFWKSRIQGKFLLRIKQSKNPRVPTPRKGLFILRYMN